MKYTKIWKPRDRRSQKLDLEHGPSAEAGENNLKKIPWKAWKLHLDKGVNFIDTAAGYGNGKSERIIGEVPEIKVRKGFMFVPKTPPAPGKWPPSPYCRMEERYSEKYLRENVEERLNNLQMECLDVLLTPHLDPGLERQPEALEDPAER